jgi:exonuclease III
MGSENVLVWNVRGLNARLHKDALRSLVDTERTSIVCIQETKLHVIDDFLVMQLLGSGFDYACLPADGTRGGILIAWHASIWSVTAMSVHRFSVSVKMKPVSGREEWWLTSVYGPAVNSSKPEFLAELNDLRQVRTGPWMLIGDFNKIYRACDKNNGRLNRRLMGQFRRFLNEALLKEVHLHGRLFTWSNERTHPTLENIDRVFVSNAWDDMFPCSDLHALSTICSDHAPLVLRTDNSFIGRRRFHFRAFWPKCAGFFEAVQLAWHCPLSDASPFHRLDWLLQNTARVLRSWSDCFISNIRLQVAMAHEVVLRLECARDRRNLAPHEEELR